VRPIPKSAPAIKSKWEGEDEDDDGPVVRAPIVSLTRTFSADLTRSSQSDWEASDEEKPAPAATAAPPPKKKGSLKQKLAEKEAARQALRDAGGSPVEYDEDAVLDPRAKARLEKELELESDLNHTTELFGSATIQGVCVLFLPML
jgi:translation initiation factor 3 subunit J